MWFSYLSNITCSFGYFNCLRVNHFTHIYLKPIQLICSSLEYKLAHNEIFRYRQNHYWFLNKNKCAFLAQNTHEMTKTAKRWMVLDMPNHHSLTNWVKVQRATFHIFFEVMLNSSMNWFKCWSSFQNYITHVIS